MYHDIGDDVVSETGFVDFGKIKHKKIHGIEVILEEQYGVLVFNARCSSPLFENELEIDTHLKKLIAEYPYMDAGFKEGRLKLTCIRSMAPEEKEIIGKASEVLEKLFEEYDMLPCCTLCSRMIPAELMMVNDKPETVCDVCSGAMKFEQIKEAKLESDRKKYESEYIAGGRIQKRPVLSSRKAGVLGGMIASAAGAVIMGMILPVLGFPPLRIGIYFLGGLMGIIIFKNIDKLSNISGIHKWWISTVSGFATLFVLSGINYLVINQMIYGGSYFRQLTFDLYKLGDPVLFQLVFGLASFAVGQAAVGIWFAPKVKPI